MPKIGIISDIHSNIDALEAVLADMEKKGVDRIICLGDMLAKYIYPDRVIDALKSNCDILIKGNCDENVVKNENFKYARSKLGSERLEYIDSLPLREQLIYQNLLLNFFHATPEEIDKIYNPYLNHNPEEMLVDNKNNSSQINFAGHIHIPYIQVLSPKGNIIVPEKKVIIEEGKDYIVNAGSVGDPLIFNGNPNNMLIAENMNYALLDMDEKETSIELVSVPYRNILVKVYQDFVRKQQIDQEGKREYPRSPKDTEKIHESLIQMGETDILPKEDIDKQIIR